MLEEQFLTIFRLAIIGRPTTFLMKPTCLCSHALSPTHIVLSCRCSWTIEHYRGIIILTTNRVKDINDTIQSGISEALHCGLLRLDTSVESEVGTGHLQSSQPREQPKTHDYLTPPTTESPLTVRSRQAMQSQSRRVHPSTVNTPQPYGPLELP